MDVWFNEDLKQANEVCDWMPLVGDASRRDEVIHQVATTPLYMALTGGGPDMVNSAGTPWSGG
ncbi:hypothetical protein GCM10010199_14540 [Dactylosporangium roseum]